MALVVMEIALVLVGVAPYGDVKCPDIDGHHTTVLLPPAVKATTSNNLMVREFNLH